MSKTDEIKDKNIIIKDIVSEMKKSYIDYSMSVIASRALPDVRDGLKPVQRRILYSMYKMNILPGSQYKKVARIVGDVIGKFHPHGDASVSDALVRMAQDFNMRYPLIEGQGNFGSIDGDPAAAMRYIEARLSKFGILMLEDIENTVDFKNNYDGNETEPVILSNKIPNLIINGVEGIAVGMATKIPPHNINEVIDGIIYLIEKGSLLLNNLYEINKIDYNKIKTKKDIEKLPKNRFIKFTSDCESAELLKYIKGPDFPTKGEIYVDENIEKMYEYGKGFVTIRGVFKVEETQNKKQKIIITEIPYQVNKSSLITKIAELYKNKKIDGISDIRDESNREGIRIVIELKKDTNVEVLKNQLYKYTELQKNFNVNFLVLVNGEPKLLNLKEILENFVSHRQEIIIRKKEFELAESKEREHILEGLMIAIDNIDEIIEIIKKSKDQEDARLKLINKFNLTEIQSQAILDLQLRRLASLERQKIENEYKNIKEKIINLIKILSSNEEILNIIKNELLEIKNKYGDERKTKIIYASSDKNVKNFDIEKTIPNESVIITISKKGYIKRTKISEYKTQNRGGIGVKTIEIKEEDFLKHIISCKNHDNIMFFTNKGKVYTLKAYEIPELQRSSKGTSIFNLIKIYQGEYVTSILTQSNKGYLLDEDIIQENEANSEKYGINYKYLLMATRKGIVKKTNIKEFKNIRSNGLNVINILNKDELIWVKPTEGNNEIILVTKLGKCIRFNENDIKPTGRNSIGVKGIKMIKNEDEVISCDVIRKKENLVLTVTENGFGKLTDISEYNIQKRGGSGIYSMKINSKTGNIAASRVLDHPKKELLIVTAKGQAVKIPTDSLPIRGRMTSGVTLIKLKENDKVTSIAII